MYRKNVAGQNLPFVLVAAADGSALTGATVTALRSIDGGAQAAATGTVSELANGQYNLALSQADTNGNQIGILLTATGAIPVHFTLVTTAADPTDVVRLGLTALPNAVAGTNLGLPLGNASGAVTLAAATHTGAVIPTVTAVTNDVGITQAGADKVWLSADRQLTTLGVLVLEIWDALTSALTTVGSIGKLLVDNIDATINSRATQTSLDAVDAIVDAILLDSNELQTDWVNGGRLDLLVDAIKAKTDVQVDPLRTGTAQAGAATTITLDAGASAIDDFYNNTLVILTGGTGAGQARFFSDYVGATKVGTVNAAWVTNPDATTTFAILAFGSIPGATAPTAIENADALLNRDMSAVSDTESRSPLNALRHIRNKWSINPGTGVLTVTKEDDTTAAWTTQLSTDPAAEPVIGSDPV